MVRSTQVFYIHKASLYGIQEGTLVNSKIPTGPMARDWTTSIIRILQIIHFLEILLIIGKKDTIIITNILLCSVSL